MVLKTVAVKVQEETYNDLIDLCKNSDFTISEYIRDLIKTDFEQYDEDKQETEPKEITITDITND